MGLVGLLIIGNIGHHIYLLSHHECFSPIRATSAQEEILRKAKTHSHLAIPSAHKLALLLTFSVERREVARISEIRNMIIFILNGFTLFKLFLKSNYELFKNNINFIYTVKCNHKL